MANVRVAAFAGSIRKDSLNRLLIENSKRLTPEGMEIDHILLDDVPVYNMDLESDFPASVVELKNRLRSADGILIAVPEHNFSYSGVVKNAIDWASRPYGEQALVEKPVILQSASPGWTGGIRAQLHLRQVLNYFPMRQMLFPEVCVGQAHKKFDEAGILTDPLAIENIQKQLAAFMSFVQGK